MGAVAADKYIPQAYTQGKKFIAATYQQKLAKFDSDDYTPPADAVRLFESEFEGLSIDTGPLDAMTRLELTELMLAKAIARGDTKRSTARQSDVLSLCGCLLDYFNDEAGRNVPPEKNVLLLKELKPNFGLYEVARLFQVTPHDIIFCRKNADDLVAGTQCYCVFKTAEDASKSNSAECEKITVHAPSDFEHFYRQCVRRVLVLNAKSKGEVLASQSLRHSLNRPMRLQLKQRAQDAIKSNQRLEDVVLEVTETLPASAVAQEADVRPFPTAVRPPAAERRPFADAAAADRPSTSSTAPNASRQAQSASLNPPPAKLMRSEGSFGSDLEEGEIP